MPRADFLTGLLLLAVAAILVIEGLTLPGAGGLIMKGGEPGRVPIFLGLVIAAMAIVLVIRAVGRQGHRLREGLSAFTVYRSAIARAIATAVGGTLYVALLGRRIGSVEFDYMWLTFAFIFFFIVIAEWKLAPAIAARRWQMLTRRAPGVAARMATAFAFLTPHAAARLWLAVTATVQAALLAMVISYVFEKQFFVQLP